MNATQHQSTARLLSVHEVAALCGVSRTTVRRLIRTNRLPAHRVGRQIRVEPRDLDRYLDSTRLTKPDAPDPLKSET